ncbi:MAG: PIN domain-containing protein [Alphaproteobacteria bacterium]|jgi:predicted nucleic-acid-binding protein|nr:PIN domain-containing protein [Alphaproteobacteria bacterium]
MIAVDTNVLVRYITNDDKEQALLATTLLDSYIGKEKSIFINNIVLCELVWVLVRGYKYQKEDIIKTLKLLLSSVEFEFENHELAFLAVIEYEKAEADFSDILIGLLNHYRNCKVTYSFDQKALKLKYFKKL